MFWPDDPDDALRIVSENRIDVTFDEQKGYIYLVDEKETQGIDDYLDELAGIGLLELNVDDNNVLVAGRLPVYETIICPECGSPYIIRESLAQHDVCGTVLPVTSFRKGDKLFCPACNAEINPEELIDLGSWYVCRSCGNRFQLPSIKFNRPEEQVKLGAEKVVYKKTYTLTPKGVSALNSPPTKLKTTLKKQFYKNFDVFYVGSFFGNVGHAEEVEIFYKRSNRPHQILILKGNSPVSEIEVRTALDSTKSMLYDLSQLLISPSADKNAIALLKRGNFPYSMCEKEEKIPEAIKAFFLNLETSKTKL